MQRLVAHLEQQPLLWVHPAHLGWREVKRLAVKALGLYVSAVLNAFQLAGAEGVHVDLELQRPALWRRIAERVAAAEQQRTEGLGACARAWPAESAVAHW